MTEHREHWRMDKIHRAHIQQIFPLNTNGTLTLICGRMVKKKKKAHLMSGWICTVTLDAPQEDDHSAKTRRVNNIMDVEQHGENQMGRSGGTFCLHTFIFVLLSL